MNEGREKLQAFAEQRLGDAEALLASERWSGAYSMSGYAVELALKARVLKHLAESDFVFGAAPQKMQLRDYWIHDLYKLIGYSGLESELTRQMSADPRFAESWSVVKEWSEMARYHETSEIDAKDLLTAIADPEHGVLQWIRRYWQARF